MPVYNSEKTISDTIKSILCQTYNKWELLITDDCSTDQTINIIKKFQKGDKRIKIYKLRKNSGAGVARNNSIDKSNGKFLAFIDADDIWKREKLQRQMDFMNLSDYKFSYTAYFTKKKDKIINNHIEIPLKVSYTDILKTCSIYTSTVIIEKELLSFPMPLIRRRQDFLTWVKILEKLDFAYGINLPLMGYNISKDSLSSNKINVAKIQYECYRHHLNFSIIRSTYYFINYMILGVIKRFKQIYYK